MLLLEKKVITFAITIPWLMTTDSLIAGANHWLAVRFFIQ